MRLNDAYDLLRIFVGRAPRNQARINPAIYQKLSDASIQGIGALDDSSLDRVLPNQSGGEGRDEPTCLQVLPLFKPDLS